MSAVVEVFVESMAPVSQSVSDRSDTSKQNKKFRYPRVKVTQYFIVLFESPVIANVYVSNQGKCL